MFSVLLGVMSLISAFGGAVRFRENFLDEVFDLIDEETTRVKSFDEDDLADNATPYLVSEEDDSLYSPNNLVEEEFQQELSQQDQIQQEMIEEEHVDQVVPYSNDQYAMI
jgi:hypothetical protein